MANGVHVGKASSDVPATMMFSDNKIMELIRLSERNPNVKISFKTEKTSWLPSDVFLDPKAKLPGSFAEEWGRSPKIPDLKNWRVSFKGNLVIQNESRTKEYSVIVLTRVSGKDKNHLKATKLLLMKYQGEHSDSYQLDLQNSIKKEIFSQSSAIIQQGLKGRLEAKGLTRALVGAGLEARAANEVTIYLSGWLGIHLQTAKPEATREIYSRLGANLLDGQNFVLYANTQAIPTVQSGDLKENVAVTAPPGSIVRQSGDQVDVKKAFSSEDLANEGFAFGTGPKQHKDKYYRATFGEKGKEIQRIITETVEESYSLFRAYQGYILQKGLELKKSGFLAAKVTPSEIQRLKEEKNVDRVQKSSEFVGRFVENERKKSKKNA